MARRRKPSKPAPAPRKRAATVPARPRVTAASAFGHGASALPTRGPRVSASVTQRMELTAPHPAGLSDVLLDLAGAEHGSLSQTLVAWQREQDRLVNRAWRRPGGLARPAGL